MSDAERKRELGRGERILPGAYRLRLPLPWPGVPHGNAFALVAGDGIVLVDTGIHEEGSLAELERALAMCGRRLEDVRLIVCTHAHSDHYGQAASIVERVGCELWMHPNHEHMSAWARDPETALERRLRAARQAGVPEEPLQRYAESRRNQGDGLSGYIKPHRDLVAGVEVDTDLGRWIVYETPGHAPSHICLFNPERRILISGDHLLGRVSLFYDYGWTADPVGEFLQSLGVVEALDARLCLSGHGRTFTDVQAHIVENRTLVESRLAGVLEALGKVEPITPFKLVRQMFGEELSPIVATWVLQETMAYLDHLETTGQVSQLEGEPAHWRLT